MGEREGDLGEVVSQRGVLGCFLWGRNNLRWSVWRFYFFLLRGVLVVGNLFLALLLFWGSVS